MLVAATAFMVAMAYPTRAPIADYLIASPAREVALARSAAPASVSKHEEVLVRTAGYVIGARGTNGWVSQCQGAGCRSRARTERSEPDQEPESVRK